MSKQRLSSSRRPPRRHSPLPPGWDHMGWGTRAAGDSRRVFMFFLLIVIRSWSEPTWGPNKLKERKKVMMVKLLPGIARHSDVFLFYLLFCGFYGVKFVGKIDRQRRTK